MTIPFGPAHDPDNRVYHIESHSPVELLRHDQATGEFTVELDGVIMNIAIKLPHTRHTGTLSQIIYRMRSPSTQSVIKMRLMAMLWRKRTSSCWGASSTVSGDTRTPA